MAEGDLISRVGWEVDRGSTQRAVSAAREVKASIEQVAVANEKTGVSASRLATGLRSLTQVASGVGGAAIAEPLRLVGDVVGALRELGPAAGIGAAAVGALSLALTNFAREQETNKALLGGALSAVDEYYNFIAGGGTVSQAREKLVELDSREGALLQEQADLQAALNVARDQEGNVLGVLSGAVRALTDLPTEQLEAQLNQVGQRLVGIDVLQNRFAKGLEQGAFAADKITAAEKELAKTHTDSAAAVQAIAAQEAAFVERINALGQQATQARAEYVTQLLDLGEDRRRRDLREEEDFNEQRAAQVQQHNARLLSIENQLNTLPVERAAKVAEAERRASVAIAQLNTQFMRSEIKAVADFRDEERKRTRDYNKQRARDLDDLHDSLLDAEQANDVIRFLQTQKEGEKRLSRGQEDFDQETQDRNAAFLVERQQARQARDARLVELQAGLQQELADIQASFSQKRTQLAEQIKAENDSWAAQQAQEDAARARRLQRQAEDERIADEHNRRSLSANLSAIDAKTNAELAGLSAVIQKASQLAASISGITPRTATGVRTATSFRGGVPIQAFQNEGVAFGPTLAFIGEHEPEAVVKLSRLLPSRLGAGGNGASIVVSPTISISGISVGDIATAAQVEQALMAYDQHITREIAAGVQRAIFSPS